MRGRPGSATIDLGAPGYGGFNINGAAGDYLGYTVDGVGDMNGDGRDEIALAGSGIEGLRDRVRALNGRFSIESPSGHGTTLEAWLPCE